MTHHVRALASLFLGTAVLLVGHGLQLALLPLRADQLGWPGTHIGLSSSVYFCGFLLGCATVPRLVASVGHVRVFTVLTASMTAALLGIALFDSLWPWLVLRALTGWAIAGLYLVVESWLNEEASNENRGALLSIYTVVVLLGMAGGQFLLRLAAPDSVDLLIVAAGCVVLAALPVGLTRIPQPEPLPVTGFSPLLVLRTSPAAGLIASVSGLTTGCFYGLGSFYGRQIGLDVPDISLMLTAGVIGGAVLQWPLGRLSDRIDRRAIGLLAMLVGVVVCALAALAPARLVLPLMFAFGGCAMPLYALALAHAGDFVDTSFLEVGTSILVMNSIGAIIGPTAAAWLMGRAGPGAFFGFCAAVLAVGALGLIVFMQRRPALRPHYSPFEVATSAAAQGAFDLDPRSDDHDDAAVAPAAGAVADDAHAGDAART